MDNRQVEQLNKVLEYTLYNCIVKKDSSDIETKEDDGLHAFIASKRV